MTTDRQRRAVEIASEAFQSAGGRAHDILEALDALLVDLDKIGRGAMGDCRDAEWRSLCRAAEEARGAIAPALGIERLRRAYGG